MSNSAANETAPVRHADAAPAKRGEKDSSNRLLLITYGVALVLLTAALSWIAYRALFSTFDVPDDDGYVLMSLRKFYDGGSLYSNVYSQYGPGLFVLVGGALRGLGVALTNDGARDYNLFLWLASTLLAGLSLLRLTRSLVISASGLVLTFLVLKVDANEPLHPGATIGFLLIAIVAAAVFLLPNRPRAALALLGGLAAALVSIKVNVGLFALVSVGFACVATVPQLRRLRWLRALAGVVLVAIPFVLMSEHLGDADTLRFAAIVSIGALGVVLVSGALPAARVPDLKAVGICAVAALGVGLLVSVVPIALGTSPADLIQGWFIRPAKTPGIQFVRLPVHPWVWVWGAAGLGLATLARVVLEAPPSRRTHLLMGFGRLAAGLLIWISLSGPIFHLPVDLTQAMVVGAPLLWLAALDPAGPSAETSFLRLLVPALAALQFLHAYPVPGSQLYWSSLLLVFVGGICIGDGVKELSEVGSSWRPDFRGWAVLASIPVAAFAVWLCLKPLRTEERQVKVAYGTGVELDLPGARQMKVPEPLALQLQELAAGIRKHCDTFMTIPGLNSLNIFAGEEPPFELAGPWPFFVNAEEQRKIVASIRNKHRFCLVAKPDVLQFWAEFSGVQRPPQRPLVAYFEDQFKLLHDYSGYELKIKSSRSGS